MASSGTTASASKFPEFKVGDTWDQCIENTIKKLAYGAIGGGLAAVILFRSPNSRFAALGLGAGVGIGMGYTDCKFAFDKIAQESQPSK